MASSFKIQSVLAGHHGEKMPGHRVAKLAGMSDRTFQKMAAGLVRNEAISREKIEGAAYYRYYLTDEQLRTFNLKKALRQVKQQAVPPRFALIADTHEIPARLSFLHMLQNRTIFREHAMLRVIISDYERTLHMRQAIDAHETDPDTVKRHR